MFRFTPASARLATRAARTSPVKIAVAVTITLFCLWTLSSLLLGRHKAADELPDMGPVVLAVKNLGQLHTVAMPMKDVLNKTTESEPEGWASNLPGAAGLTHWATHNEALVIAEGTVEAGVDLSQITEKDVTRIKRPDGKTVVQVHLPPVTVYPPNVQVRVERSETGPFFRDENIVPKAQAEAMRRFAETAEKAGIRATAQAQAIERLKAMQKLWGNQDVEFTF